MVGDNSPDPSPVGVQGGRGRLFAGLHFRAIRHAAHKALEPDPGTGRPKTMTGSSDASLVKKLGYKQNFRVKLRNAPDDYLEMVGPLPENMRISTRLRGDVDIWHLFTTSSIELGTYLRRAMGEIRRDGMIRVSWPKQSSGVTTDITEDTVRRIALPMGLVDIKVCAVDEVWSGLKLVIRKELR